MLAVGWIAETCQVYFIVTTTGTTFGTPTWYHSTITATMGACGDTVSATKTGGLRSRMTLTDHVRF